jgi:hypothetical protein
MHRRVAGHVQVADRLPAGDERDLQWHEPRKASKRLRYAAEAASPVLGKPANRSVKQVKHVQELLGDHQDAFAARPVLREIGIAAHLDGENGLTDAGHLHAGDTTRAWRDLRRSMRKLAALENTASVTNPEQPGQRVRDDATMPSDVRRASAAVEKSLDIPLHPGGGVPHSHQGAGLPGWRPGSNEVI